MSTFDIDRPPPPDREDALFVHALEQPAADRALFLDRVCARHPVLRARLEALLAAHEAPDGVLANPKGATQPTISLDLCDFPDPAVGQTIGRYKLLERIGEGGCGVVYVAEQTQPVRRRVALKVIKLGMDTREVIARFEAERQALAMMDHPNIAKVLDAGTTGNPHPPPLAHPMGEGGRRPGEGGVWFSAGRPFFVMELVRGIRITDYCDRNELSTQERLDLFVRVCQAIQHAHQKGIIHRDIKPSNILVTLHDGVPVPKVIDFGIAKATEGRLTDATIYTQLHQFIGTPAYMSPEQAEMSGLDIDTRSDIYSLGVLLYELLTGTTPFDAKQLIASGLDAMRKTIREKEPLRPSTRLNQTLLARAANSASPSQIANRKSQIDPDLDWIVMKCLEKDRARRYETANGLAADIRRHLNCEPVVARPPSALYRFHKAFRRNKLVFVAGTVVALALVLGFGISTWQWRSAEEARRVAIDRDIAETKAKQNETRQLQNAQAAYARVAELLCQLEIQKAEELFVANKPSQALAYLARAFREHPSNPALANRIASALSRFSFAWPQVDLTGHRALRFSADGRQFITISERGAHLWETASGQPVAPPFAPGSWLRSAEFSPDERQILTLSSASETDRRVHIQIWDAATTRPVGAAITPTNGILRSARLSRDGRRILTSASAPTGNRGVHLQIWDAATGRPVGASIHSTNGTAEFSPEGRWAITCSSESAQVWDGQTGQLLHTISSLSNSAGFTSASFTPNAQRIITTTAIGVQIWDRSTGRLESTVSDKASYHGFRRTTLSSGADRWLSFSARSVHTFDIASGRLLAEVYPGSSVNHVEFSPDGQRILTLTTDRVIRIWDAGTGQLLGESLKHDMSVSSARFSPNGQSVLTLCADGTGRIWDSFSGLLLIDGFRVVDTPESRFSGVANFSPDGRFVAIPSGDRHRLWKLSMAPLQFDRIGPDGPESKIPGTPLATGLSANPLSGPAPAWFPEVIEAVAGQRLTGEGALEPVPFADRLKVGACMVEMSEENAYTHLGRWLFADGNRRTVSPFSAGTVGEYVQNQIQQDSLASLQRALRLSPASGLAMSRLAVHLAAQDPLRNPRRTAEAGYFSRRALELAADEPEVWLARAGVLATLDRLTDALQVNENAIERFPGDAEIWNQRGELLERGKQFKHAEQAYSRAIELTQNESAEFTDRPAHYLLNRADARERQTHSVPASEDRLAGLQWLQRLQLEDSPHWGGNDPGRNLFAPATGLPASFDLGWFWLDTDNLDLRSSHGVRFILPLGTQSYESPAIAHGRIFVGTNNDYPRDPRHQGDRSILMCLDEKSGAFLWQLVIPKLKSGKVNDWENLGLLSTPTVEGNRVYLVTTRCEVLCLTTDGLAKGNVGPFRDESRYAAGPGNPEVEPSPNDADIIWRYDMMDELGVFPHNGTRTHALIVGDLLYVGTCNGQDWTHANIPSPHSPSLIALNKFTGELMAEDDAGIGPRILHGQWSSPSTGRVGERQLIFYGGGDGVCYAFDAVPVTEVDQRLLKKVWWADCNPPEYKTKDGKPIRYPAAEGVSEILATPVFWRNRVYVAIGQDPEHGEGAGNLVCLDATRQGDITESGILWSYRRIHRSMSTAAITPEGLLFIADFSGFIHCLDAETGRPYWVHDMKAHIWGSTLVADGKVYVGDEDGDFVVFAADREKQVLSSTFRDGEAVDGPNLVAPMYSTPVVANGVVYFNSVSHLFAIEDPSGRMELPLHTTALQTRNEKSP